jgi:hypothetical protein
MKLPADFREFVELMISNNVSFVMIGGYAFNLYGNPRATGDIDFFVSCDSGNELKLRQVLTDFGFGSTLPEGRPLIEEGKLLMLGRAPFRIDLITRIDGVEFSEALASAWEFSIDELTVPVISPELLLQNKLASGRPKDLEDAEQLREYLDTNKHE